MIGITPEAYHDLAKLLMSINEVESADVPSAMQVSHDKFNKLTNYRPFMP